MPAFGLLFLFPVIMENTGAYVWITFDPWDYASSDKIDPAFDSGGEIRVELIKKA